MKIVLAGFMGCGKTTVGKKLARLTGYKFIDIDEKIVDDAGMGIVEIFERHGEAYFRKLEQNTIKSILDDENVVISVGGGAILNDETADLLKSSARVIFLDVDVRTVMLRTQGDTKRPLLQGPNKRQRVADLLKERHPVYRKNTTDIVDGRVTAAKVARKIIEILELNIIDNLDKSSKMR